MNAVAFGPRLSWAVTGGWDGHLLKWDPARGLATERWVVGPRPVTAVAASPDGSLIYAGDMDGRLTIWNSLSRHQEALEPVHTRPIGGIAVAGNGKAYATAGWDGIAHVWLKSDDEAEPWRKLVLRGHQDLLAGCKFWPDGRWLLTWSHDAAAILWDLTRGAPYQTWSANGHRITAADIAPDATFLVVGTADGILYLWNLHDSQHPPYRWQDERPLKAVCFSPNARELIVVNDKGKVCCLHVPQFYPTCPPTQLGFEAQAAAMPATGDCVAVGSDDGSLVFVPLPHLARCEAILTPIDRIEEHADDGLWAKLTGRTKVVRMRRASCPKCGRLLELPSDALPPPGPCPGCGQSLAFTAFTLAG